MGNVEEEPLKFRRKFLTCLLWSVVPMLSLILALACCAITQPSLSRYFITRFWMLNEGQFHGPSFRATEIAVHERDYDTQLVARSFVRAIGAKNENRARSFLSAEALAAVDLHCGGRVIACFEDIGMSDWGRFKEIYFVYGSHQSYGYHMIWTNKPIWAVVITDYPNSRAVVTGWRGFISNIGMTEDELAEILKGTNPVNQFPPTGN